MINWKISPCDSVISSMRPGKERKNVWEGQCFTISVFCFVAALSQRMIDQDTSRLLSQTITSLSNIDTIYTTLSSLVWYGLVTPSSWLFFDLFKYTMSYPTDFAGDLNSVEDLINSASSSMKTEIDWVSQRPYPSSAGQTLEKRSHLSWCLSDTFHWNGLNITALSEVLFTHTVNGFNSLIERVFPFFFLPVCD